MKPFRYILAARAASTAALMPTFANAARMDKDGTTWQMLSQYGDWPNQSGLQRFAKADAQNIVNDFESIVGLVTGDRVLGLPWYVGHPDHEIFKGKPGHTDTAAKGRIKRMEARDDGLWANVKWNEDGKKLIAAEAFHGHSVNWRMKRDGGAWRPTSLKSVGFTNDPQIPVPPVTFANAAAEGVDVVMVANAGERVPAEVAPKTVQRIAVARARNREK